MQIDHTQCVVKTPWEPAAKDWTSFLVELELVLARLVVHGRAFVVLRVDRPDDAFVQFCVTKDGLVSAEAAVSVFRPGCCSSLDRHRLKPMEKLGLARMGWNPPHDGDGDPDSSRMLWHRDADPRWTYFAPLYAELLTRTMYEVFRVDSPGLLKPLLGNMSSKTSGLARAA